MTFMEYLKSRKFTLIIIGICLILVIVFIWLFIASFTQQGVKVDAHITSITKEQCTNNNKTYYEHYAYVEYQVDGTTYNSKIQCRKDNYTGQKISIYYDPQNPANAWLLKRDFLDFSVLFLGLPICFISICVTYGTRKSIIFGGE